MKTGEAIKYLREKRNLTQKELANLLGITLLTMQEIEEDIVTPSEDSIASICKILDMPPLAFQFITLQTEDIVERKRDLFNQIQPAVMSLINEIWLEKKTGVELIAEERQEIIEKTQ